MKTNIKILAAVIGGSAVVVMGALSMAVAEEHHGADTVASRSMTLGATSAQTTPPAAPEIAAAAPAIKGPAK